MTASACAASSLSPEATSSPGVYLLNCVLDRGR